MRHILFNVLGLFLFYFGTIIQDLGEALWATWCDDHSLLLTNLTADAQHFAQSRDHG